MKTGMLYHMNNTFQNTVFSYLSLYLYLLPLIQSNNESFFIKIVILSLN